MALSQSRARCAYLPFGHRNTAITRTGYGGELSELPSSTYSLGNGHRHFNPTLNRFLSADRLSPFTVLNAYAYCNGDPLNWVDPSGQIRVPVLAITKAVARARRRMGQFKIELARVDRRMRAGLRVKPQDNIRSRTINLLHRYIGLKRPEIEALNLEKLLYVTTSPRVRVTNAALIQQVRNRFPNTIATVKSDAVLRNEYMKPLEAIYVKRQYTWRRADTDAFDDYTLGRRSSGAS